MKQRKPPKGPLGIANRLRKMAEKMITLGTEMEYYSGFDTRMVDRGIEMVNAGLSVRQWAEGIENDVQ